LLVLLRALSIEPKGFLREQPQAYSDAPAQVNNGLSQDDVNLMMSHINSYAQKALFKPMASIQHPKS
jgi:hypothetical protein